MANSVALSATNLRRRSFIFDMRDLGLNLIWAGSSEVSETDKEWPVFHFSEDVIIVCQDSTQDISARVVARDISGPIEMPRVSELSREERVKIARSAFGMWADREDLGDTADYVSRLRASWERAAECSEVD
jgi:hypothetical protein